MDIKIMKDRYNAVGYHPMMIIEIRAVIKILIV